MAANKFVSNFILLPMSKLYGLGVGFRNLLFSCHLLKRRRFDIPVIVIGNIKVGGSGKTPHAEYVINLLRHDYHIGVLSRGYKRKTKGFVLATSRSTPLDIGDEPYQIYQKFGRDVTVAVCESRCEGIDELRKIDPKINMIVLDDAFQHRYVEPDIAIVLTEFNSPAYMDKLLPLGRLREPASALRRADIIVVTKCPERIKPLEYKILDKNLGVLPYQHLFFSRYVYPQLRPVFPEEATSVPNLQWLTENDSVLIISGIANPRPFVRYVKSFHALVRIKIFPDHHNFTRKDIDMIAQRYKDLPGENRYMLTTEKDAVRLANNPYFPHALKSKIFYQPVLVDFDNNATEPFEIVLKRMISEKKL